ncbi:RNA polymerase factor sigma-54 [Martelella endophytica]|uniref:RNA polymerase sigma-54 factor n=1 Tax=Martelella endophytica TaxID=1486262 RepID=A0A0D5LVI1_MAREN|nr:RNA polymerase factor sigma-54 [Martelella endophytica]AJY47368.1 RNA polymerase sigma54 factor [Martelella endophytica]
MALNASLLLKQSQSMVMTPQLMQSIQLLQMPHLELAQFIAHEVEKNPLLELSNSDETRGEDAADAAEAPEAGAIANDWYSDDQQPSPQLAESLDSNYDNAFTDDAPAMRPDAPELMSQWKSMPGAGGDDHVDLDEFVAERPCLRDHLVGQIALSFRTAADQAIARYLVDYVDEAGYFRGEVDDIAALTGVASADVVAVLARLKSLDPPGIFAESLSDCMRQQLSQTGRLDPVMSVLIDNLDLLARRDFARLKKLCGVNEDTLLAMLRELRTLNPKPGSAFSVEPPESVIPDVIVSARGDGDWQIELNPETLPRVLVNRPYLAEVRAAQGMSEADQNFLNTCLQNANWLTRSLDQRARTILKVAGEIVRQQDAFLRQGVHYLRPLNLKTVADAIKMHESTVSRVTSNKYILTPRGLYELKYFFSVSIATADATGDAHSAESVRHRIRQMIGAETADAVLSDDDIVAILAKDDITLARRTVAKYREAMNIPSSVQRRREKRAHAKVMGS